MSIFENDDDEDDTVDHNKLYEENKQKCRTEMSQLYKDLAKNQCKKLRDLVLPNNKTLGDLMENSRIGWKPELQLTSNEPEEERAIFDLLAPKENPNIKIIGALLILLEEVKKLISNVDQKILNPLFIYGDEEGLLSDVDATENQDKFLAKMFGFFKELPEFLKEINALLRSIVNQMHNLYNSKLPEYKGVYHKIMLEDAFDSIGSLLSVFIYIDSIVGSNIYLAKSWKGFKTLLYAARTETTKFNLNDQQVKKMEKLFKKLEEGVLSGEIFKQIIVQDLNLPNPTQGTIIQNKDFKKMFKLYLTIKIARLEKKLGIVSELDDSKTYIPLVGIFALYCKIFNEFDQDQYKLLWHIQAKAPVIPIIGHVIFISEDFLKKNCEISKVKKLEPADMKKFRLDYLKNLDTHFAEKVEELYMRVSEWCGLINSPEIDDIYLCKKHDITANNYVKILVSGITLATEAKKLVTDLLLLHNLEKIEIPLNLHLPVVQAISIMKGINVEIESKMTAISLLFPIMKRLVQNQLITVWENCEKNIEKLSKSDWRDFLKILIKFALETAHTSITPIRYELLHLLRPIICSKDLILDKTHFEGARKYFGRMAILFNFHNYLNEATKVPYIYKFRNLIYKFMGRIPLNGNLIQHLKYLFNVCEDSADLLKSALYLDKDELYLRYKEELMTKFETVFVTELINRLISYMKEDQTQGFKQLSGNEAFRQTIKDCIYCEPIFWLGEKISLKQIIEDRLSKKLYNIPISQPKEWEICEEIRSRANTLFGLNVSESLLPQEKTEQGMDIIYILKHLSDFISNYHYSLHTQVFFETMDENYKSINVFGITQAENSFHTHGLGIQNTLLNACFKLMTKKVNSINTLLFDEALSNMLYGEFTYWKENRDCLGFKYPLDRTEEIIAKTGTFGVFQDGKGVLEKFIQIITNVGNIIGFVSVIQAAHKRHNNGIKQFLFKDMDSQKFFDLALKSEQLEETLDAANLLDEILKEEDVEEEQDFYELFLKIFDESTFSSEDCQHLEKFYLLIPTLTVIFVNSFLQTKNILRSRNTNKAFFTEDGFAIGIAYILSILGQNENFDEINWFDSVIGKYTKDKEYIGTAQTADQNEKLTRASAFEREYQWIYYSFVAAQRYFK